MALGGALGPGLVAAPAQYSTSRLHYHLNLKGPLVLQVIVQKLDEDPWQGIPAVHPLVPLAALDRVRDRKQICVSVNNCGESRVGGTSDERR